MIDVWIYSLASVFIVSLISFIGVLSLLIHQDLKKVIFFLVSFSAGALFGDAFIHLIPHAFGEYGATLEVSLAVLLGIFAFFVLEKFIHWRHCHVPTSKSHPHHLGVMNLVGDAFHNFLDGLIIAGSYMADITVGVATTLAVILHEIPQEIGDFGVLLYAGYSKGKALLYNFISACFAILGALAVLIIGKQINLDMFLIPFAAGGFIYIAGSDLIPEMKKDCGAKESIIHMIGMLLGIMAMILLVMLE